MMEKVSTWEEEESDSEDRLEEEEEEGEVVFISSFAE